MSATLSKSPQTVMTVQGLPIAIENLAYTYRKNTDKTGQQWTSLMKANYGYAQGYTGKNGSNIGVFVGAVPEIDTAYIINQKTAGGFFDEHKVMLGFMSQQQAVDTYQQCFERGLTGLMSVVPCTSSQLKWWLANGDKSRPVTLERLPYAGLERLDSVVWGGTDGSNLYSHGGQVNKLLYQIRQCDDSHQALEPLSYNDMVQELGNQGFIYENYDALVIEYNKLERKAKQLLMVMQGAASEVKPVGVTVSKPLTKGGVANVIAWFEMDDGQAVGVFFHNPDKTPKKIDPTDEMISYKWVLNKKDITIAVAPENGKDLVIRTVAKRIMQLVEKNHDRFIKANSAKAELNLKEQDLNAQVIAKQSQLDMLNKDIELLEAQKAEKEAKQAVIEQTIEQEQVSSDLANLSFVRDDFDKQKYHLVDNNGKQYQTIFKSGSSWAMNSGESFKTLVEAKQAAIDNAKFWMKMQQEEAASRAEVEAMSKEKSDNKTLEAQKAEKEAIQAQSDKPYSEKIIDALVANHGWTLSTPTSATKEFAGMAESGEMSDGTRVLTASFDSRGRYIGINKDGWSNDPIPETDMDMRNYMGSPLSGAREFNDAVDAYVAKQRKAVKPAKTATLASFSSVMLGGTSLSELLKADVDNIYLQSPLHEKAKQDTVDAGNSAIKVIGSKNINDFASYATTFAKTNEALLAAIDPSVMVSPIIYRRKIKVPKYMVTGDDPKHYIENRQTDFEDFRISVIDKGDGAHVKVEYKDNYGHWWNMKNNAMESRVFEPITSKAIEIFNQYKASKTDIFATQSALVAAPPTVEQETVAEPTIERPSNWRTNLANARAVAKSLGIETKGKKLDRLLKDIDFFDENEVKKELLAEFKALASRLVLPKGYIFDLKDAEKSIDNAGYLGLSPMIKKQGKADTNTIRIELRTIPDSSQDVIFSSVHFYTDDKNTKKELDKLNYQNFDSIGRSEAITPKAVVSQMEAFLTKAVFPKIEYLKVANSTSVDVSKLADIGIAEITDLGDENIYFEKDGKYYISKVGNTEDYALGEWDFAKYPEGKLAAPVMQPEQAPVASSLETLKELSKNTEFDSWAIKHGVDEGVAKSILDTNINGRFLFELVMHDLPPNDELLKFQDGSILTYYRAKSEDVKSLSDEAFSLLLSQDDYNEKTGYFAYNILRNSNKKAELDYVSSLGAMNNRFRLDAQKYGGKLYKMAQPYLNNQTVEAQPEPVSEPTTSNPDRDYLQSIIDGKDTGLEPKAITAKIRQIIVKAKDENDTEILVLADQAAKAYAAQVKAKAAAKLAEVQ